MQNSRFWEEWKKNMSATVEAMRQDHALIRARITHPQIAQPAQPFRQDTATQQKPVQVLPPRTDEMPVVNTETTMLPAMQQRDTDRIPSLVTFTRISGQWHYTNKMRVDVPTLLSHAIATYVEHLHSMPVQRLYINPTHAMAYPLRDGLFQHDTGTYRVECDPFIALDTVVFG